jgi:dimethylamine/trimethylamine dehydrogenase
MTSVLNSYEDEIINEAFFLAFAGCLQSRTERDKLALLARVERQAAAALLPLLDRYGLAPRDDAALHELGQADFAAGGAGSWRELMRQISATYPKYVAQFRALESRAPAADRAALARLRQHEVATIEFARQELRGTSTSADLLYAFLEP